MKLAAELPYVVGQFQKVENIEPYAKQFERAKGNSYIQVRMAWDIAHTCISSATMCEWYDKYECSDAQLITLFKKALKIVYPKLYEMGEDGNNKY